MEIFILTDLDYDRDSYPDLEDTLYAGMPFLSMEAATTALNSDLEDETAAYNTFIEEGNEPAEAPVVKWIEGVQSDGYAEWTYYSEEINTKWLLRRFTR